MGTNLKTFLLIILFSGYIFPYSWLYVQDPRGWNGGQGTIEEAVISVKPQGIYTEYGLYLTFSARDYSFTNADTLEVQFYFDLPAGSIVVDSWLWVEDDIIKGEIMDQWTASAIYEEIVNRRKDPSILFKRYDNQYELRIFPMAGDKTRKVKITYLAPTQWNMQNVTSQLPNYLFQVSYNPLSKADIILWKDSTWQNPKIVEYPDIEFTAKTDTIYGDYFHALIPGEIVSTPLTFSTDALFNNGFFVSKYGNGNEGIYQLAFLPSKALESIKAFESKKST